MVPASRRVRWDLLIKGDASRAEIKVLILFDHENLKLRV